MVDNAAFSYGPSADHPGWYTWDLKDQDRFNSHVMGPLLVRREDSPGGAIGVRLRMFPERRHSNLLDAVHGGITLSLIDVSLFACMRHAMDGDAAGSVTLDLSTQFIGAGIGFGAGGGSGTGTGLGGGGFMSGGAVSGNFTIAAELKASGATTLAVNSKQVAEGNAGGLITKQPQDELTIGEDAKSAVGEYETPHALKGGITNVKITSH